MRFVFEHLPKTRADLDILLREQLKSEEQVLIGLARIRDFYNPELLQTGAEGEKPKANAAEDFARFVHALLLKWIDLTETPGEEQATVAQAICLHLKELSTANATGPTIVAYLSSQMQSLTGMLSELRLIEEESRDFEALERKKRDMLLSFGTALLRL